MSVLTTTLSSGGAFAPLGDVTSSARPGVWRACDIPTNHSILCGAKIAAVSETGQYAGFCGQIGGADINISVSKGKALFDVRYDVLYDNGERYRVSPLKVFRKYLSTCRFLALYVYTKTYSSSSFSEGLLYYKQYAVSDNDVVARQQFEETDAHIRNLCDLNDCVRSANVLEQHVCRRIRINDTATEHTFLVGRVWYVVPGARSHSTVMCV
jgi:hypothetical protein